MQSFLHQVMKISARAKTILKLPPIFTHCVGGEKVGKMDWVQTMVKYQPSVQDYLNWFFSGSTIRTVEKR